MAIEQLSIFISNEKGALAEITETFFEEKIDVRALSVSDTTEYGILRMIVDDTDRAETCLKEKGVIVKKNKVLAINPEDEKGSLTRIFRMLSANDINIDYVYSFVVRQKEDQYFVLKVNNIARAEKLLTEKGIDVINSL